MPDRAFSIDPGDLCETLDTMPWAELERVGRAIIASFAMVVEAPGAQRREITIKRPHPEGSAPRVTPLCSCGCVSQLDHWRHLLEDAVARDMARDGQARDFRHMLFRAAEDLWAIGHSPRHPVDADGNVVAAASGPERSDYICNRYQGIPARRAAVWETRRTGSLIDTAAIRRTRQRNGYGMELGEPRAPDEETLDEVLTLHRMGTSDREIARLLDMGRTAVSNMLDGRRTVLGDEQAQAA